MRTIFSFMTLSGLLLFILIAGGCKRNPNSYSSSPTSPYTTNPPPNTVVMSGTTFSPTSITVSVGTTVTWKNNDGYAHTATSDNGAFDTGNIGAGASASYKFSTAGTYPYHCTYHVGMGMRGTVIVQ